MARSRTEIEKERAAITQKLAKLRGELQAAKDAERQLRDLAEADVLDGKENGRPIQNLRDNQARQQVCQVAIAAQEALLASVQREISDLDLAELSRAWAEVESEMWRALPIMMKNIAELNRLTVQLHEKVITTKAYTPDGVTLQMRAGHPLQEVSIGMFRAWQALQSLNLSSPKPVEWQPTDKQGEVAGFGRKL